MTLSKIGSNGLVVVLSLLLCNAPEYLAAQSTSPTPNAASTQSQATADQNVAGEAQSQPTRPDPSQAPLAPAPTSRTQDNQAVPPDAPSEVQRSQQAQQAEAAPAAQPVKQGPANPLGTAAAQKGATRGGVASKPAG